MAVLLLPRICAVTSAVLASEAGEEAVCKHEVTYGRSTVHIERERERERILFATALQAYQKGYKPI